MKKEEREAVKQYLKIKKNQQEYNMNDIIEELYQKVLEENRK